MCYMCNSATSNAEQNALNSLAHKNVGIKGKQGAAHVAKQRQWPHLVVINIIILIFITKHEFPQPGAPRSQPAQEAPPAGNRREGTVQHAQLGPQAGVPAGHAEAAAHQRHMAQPAQVDATAGSMGLPHFYANTAKPCALQYGALQYELLMP